MALRFVVAFVVLFFAGHAAAQVPPRSTTGLYRKLDSALARTVAALDAGQPRAALLAKLGNPLTDAVRVPVTIRVHDLPRVSVWLRETGAAVANSGTDVIEAYVTPEQLRGLSALPSVIRVRQILPAQKKAVSQAVTVHNAANWHNAGVRGGGVKVGIVDDFDGFMALMGTELPASITGRCYTSIGTHSPNLANCDVGSDHGTAVAESLIDVAPQVQLFIANPISQLDLRETVDWMTGQGVRVINYSAAQLWDGPGDGTSPFSDSALKTVDAAAAANAVFLSAAGNEGTATYLGPFVDGNGNDWAEFSSGGLDDNTVFLEAGETITVQLRWQDSWTASNRDLNLYIYDEAGFQVSVSDELQDGTPGSTPFEWLTFTPSISGTYYVAVGHIFGSLPSWIQLQNLTSQEFEFFTSGSIGSPAESANAAALSVGAAPWFAPATLESFSSRGPTPDGRVKPDVVGVDGADTTTYGPGGFFGTSQATPHVAGLAALIFNAYPAASALDVAGALRTIANPGYGARPNNDWGYGLPVLPNYCAYALAPPAVSVSSGQTSSTVAVTAGSGCAWTAASQAGFLTITAGASGSGNGTVSYTVAGNPTGTARVGTLTIAGRTFTVSQRGRNVAADFNGNGAADIAVFRPSNGVWYIRGAASPTWGGSGDVPLAGDFDGDGKADVAVYRPSTGTWFVLRSSGGSTQQAWGGGSDQPVPGDYDGDGRTDMAVFRPSTGVWFVLRSSGGSAQYTWGGGSDVPTQADYDGDGITDVAIFRPSSGVWYVRSSATGAMVQRAWGGSIDTAVPGDYDGDARADIAVFRPSTSKWYILFAAGGSVEYTWGGAGDVAVPEDYDGDGRTDIAIFRPSTGAWFIIQSATNTSIGYTWGGPGDLPVARK